MTNNTIPNVPRELLERVLNAGWGSETVNALDDLRDFLESAPSPANHVEDVRAMVADPSPAGVDGCKCSMSISMLGDGCRHCQPQEYIDRLGEMLDEERSELSDAQAIIDGLRGEVERLQRAEKNDAIAYKAVLERQDELRAELAAIKAKSVMPDVNLAAKALCSRHAVICGVDEDDQWKEYGQDFIADAETVLANSRLCAATVLEVNAHCAVIPEPYGWVAAGSFYTDRESAICAAEKTPCIDVYSRPQMNALENRSLQRQELAEELARQLNASCAEIRNMRNLYAAPVSEAKAQDLVLQELRSFEKWWCSTPILRESKRTIAEKAWLAARLNAAPAAPAADAGLVEALEHARLFIVNGIDLGFIQMPEAGTPDPAHETLPMIDAALAAHRAKGVV